MTPSQRKAMWAKKGSKMKPMKFSTLCRMPRKRLIFDKYTEEVLTVEDAISTIMDRWTDYDGDLYPVVNVNRYGIPDLNQPMTKEFADMFASDMIPYQPNARMN